MISKEIRFDYCAFSSKIKSHVCAIVFNGKKPTVTKSTTCCIQNRTFDVSHLKLLVCLINEC